MPPQQPFSRAHPLAAFTKSIFMRILKNIALQILWKQQNSEKKNICTLAWGVFFFCLFPNQSQCAKHLTETDLPNQLISRDWSAVCAVCITITALLHCQTLEAAQAAIFEKRLTFKHCLFEQCGRALPLVYMYTLFKVIKSKSYFESRTRVVSPCPLSCLTDSRATKCSSFKGTYLFQPLLYHRILFLWNSYPSGS